MSWVTGPSALVGVVSVSPVTRAAMTPMITDSGSASTPAHTGIWKRYAISPTATGPRMAKPSGNQAGGHSMSARGSFTASGFLENSAARALNERATLRHWNAKDSRPEDTSSAAPVHSVHVLMDL